MDANVSVAWKAWQAKSKFGNSAEEKRTQEMASLMLGHTVKVDCTPLSDIEDKYETLGQVQTYTYGVRMPAVGDVILTRKNFGRMKLLSGSDGQLDICSEFVAAAEKAGTDAVPTVEQTIALATVSHEGKHVGGVMNESEAECYAAQSLRSELNRLGYTDEQVEYTTSTYKQIAWEYLPDEYKSTECRPGGEYDLGISGDYLDGKLPQREKPPDDKHMRRRGALAAVSLEF